MISSLEVEVSTTADDLLALDGHDPRSNYPRETIQPLSSQQTASEAFSFLTARKSQRQSTKTSTSDRPLPALPPSNAQPLISRFSASTLAITMQPRFSTRTLATTVQPLTSRFSAYSSADSHESEETKLITSPTPDETLPAGSEDNPNPHETQSIVRSVYQKYSGEWPTESNQEIPGASNESVETKGSANTLREGPKLHRVVVTKASVVPSRTSVPRGPRPISYYPVHVAIPKRPELPKDTVIPRIIEPAESEPEPRNAFEECSRPLSNPAASAPDLSVSMWVTSADTSTFTPAPLRKSHHRRTSSQRTIASPYAYTSYGPNVRLASSLAVKPPRLGKANKAPTHNKENSGNQPTQAVYKSQILPMTPAHTQSVFRGAQTPSPASSVDLSPVAKLMMSDLRTQRMEARKRQQRSWGPSRLR